MVKRFKSRQTKLEDTLNEIISGDTKILKRVRQLELNKINGALRQTIDAHGDINKVLIGSAAKRIWGSLLDSEQFKLKKKISIKTFVIGLFFGLFFCIFA
mgnify:CR=1 FL=1